MAFHKNLSIYFEFYRTGKPYFTREILIPMYFTKEGFRMEGTLDFDSLDIGNNF